jgi:hypothetical protein
MKWIKGILFGLLGMFMPMTICWFMIICNKSSLLFGNMYDNYIIGIVVGIFSIMCGFILFIEATELKIYFIENNNKYCERKSQIYFDKVDEKIDNLSDEEFDQLLDEFWAKGDKK